VVHNVGLAHQLRPAVPTAGLTAGDYVLTVHLHGGTDHSVAISVW